jgi:hypothetical protein
VYRLVGSISLFALAAFVLIMRRQGMRTGKLPERGAILSRDKNPRTFQYAQIAYMRHWRFLPASLASPWLWDWSSTNAEFQAETLRTAGLLRRMSRVLAAIASRARRCEYVEREALT